MQGGNFTQLAADDAQQSFLSLTHLTSQVGAFGACCVLLLLA